jgi:hypothetical protein
MENASHPEVGRREAGPTSDMGPSSCGRMFQPHAGVDELKKMTARDQAFQVSVRQHRQLMDVVSTHDPKRLAGGRIR